MAGKEVKIVEEWENKFFEIFYTSIRDNSNAIIGVIGIAADVTVHKRIQEQLEHAKQLAEDTAKIKENFLANMSHEIRTPMNAIMGFSKLILLRKEQPKQEFENFLNIIIDNSQKLLNLINDIDHYLSDLKLESDNIVFVKL